MRSAAALLVLLLHGSVHAAPAGPPPDPSRGETFDGRPRRASWRADVLAVPRIMLAPLRVLVRALEWSARPGTEWAERVHLLRRVVRLLTSADGLIGVRPSLSYTSSFVPLFGLTFFDHRFIGPSTAFDLTFQFGDPRILYTAMHLRPLREHRAVGFDFDAIYNRRDDRLFTGIGADAARNHPGSRYAIDQIDLIGSVPVYGTRTWRALFIGGFGVRRFGDGRGFAPDLPITQVFCVRDAAGACIPGTVDESQVPGFHQGTQFVRGAAHVFADTRDSLFRPTSGAAGHLSVAYAHGLGFDTSSWFRFHGGVEAAIDLWERSRVMIARVTADAVVPAGGGPVPFSELVMLGGPDDLRGARVGKYRDFSSVLLSLEYRWPIWMWMDGSLFVDYGGVFGQGFAGISTVPMVTSLGGGIRLRTMSQFFARVQIAYGFGEGVQVFAGASVEP
jgi:Omp85 superfamily domain